MKIPKQIRPLVILLILLPLLSACPLEQEDPQFVARTLSHANQQAIEHWPHLTEQVQAFRGVQFELEVCSTFSRRSTQIGVYQIPAETTRLEFQRTVCTSPFRRSRPLGTFEHALSCRPHSFPLLKTILAETLENPTLVQKAIPSSLPRVRLAHVARQASRLEGSDAEEVKRKWMHFAALLSSAPLSPAPERRDQVAGAFVEKRHDTLTFREFAAARRQVVQKHIWPALETPTWQKLTTRAPIRALLSQTRPMLAVQEMALMMDLSDLVLIHALLYENDDWQNLHLVEVEHVASGNQLKSIWNADILPSEEQTATRINLKRIHATSTECPRKSAPPPETLFDRVRQLRHMKLASYKHLLNMEEQLRDEEFVQSLMRRTGLSVEELKAFAQRVQKVRAILLRACSVGNLRLDLDFDKILQGRETTEWQCHPSELVKMKGLLHKP